MIHTKISNSFRTFSEFFHKTYKEYSYRNLSKGLSALADQTRIVPTKS